MKRESPPQTPPSPERDAFDDLVAKVMVGAPRFGHEQHLHITWLAVRRFGRAAAIDLVGRGIQRTARYAGAPRKYNATLSRAWVELVAYHTLTEGHETFQALVSENPALLDKSLVLRFYQPVTLGSERARRGWVAPDRAPFPWHRS